MVEARARGRLRGTARRAWRVHSIAAVHALYIQPEVSTTRGIAKQKQEEKM